jgi:transcriptional regulator with XRE-family HTH domain
MQPTPPGRGEFARLLADMQRDTPGLSYQKLADAAGVHRSQVWRWINANSTPGYEPVRRLASWLTEHYPHLADTAARLLPAAGYGAPDEPTLPGIPAAGASTGPDPIAVRIGQAIADELKRIAAGIQAEIDAARRAGIPDPDIFEDPFERNLWLTELTPEDQRVLAIAALRSVRPRRPNSNTSPPPIELAG